MNISIIAVRGIVAEVARLGFPTRGLLDISGIDEQDLSNISTRTTVESFEALVGAALALTQCPTLGLSVGDAAPEFQLMTQFAQALPTLRDAVHMLRRYARIVVSEASVGLSEQHQRARFSFDIAASTSPQVNRFCTEVFASLCFRVGAQVFTSGRAPIEVHVRHAEPVQAERYLQVFGCPVVFSASENAILFESSLLDLRQPLADTFMADVLRAACESLLANAEPQGALSTRVLHLLRHQPDLCHIDLEKVARELGTKVDVLRRNLSRQGVTLSRLIEQVRIEAAAAEMLRPHVSLKELAGKIGYSDASSFHRAFKRCMGKTPGAYMREHQAPRT